MILLKPLLAIKRLAGRFRAIACDFLLMTVVLIVKIFIQQIQPDGIELGESFPCEWTGLTRKDSIYFISPIASKAKITRVDDEVFAKMTTAGRYESYCYRCLEDLKRDWVSDFTLIFNIDRQTEIVDMDEDIRQEIILNLPARLLCGEDCKGLCAGCGVNLNTELCLCGQNSKKDVKVQISK